MADGSSWSRSDLGPEKAELGDSSSHDDVKKIKTQRCFFGEALLWVWLILQASDAESFWPYYCDITVDADQVASEQTNFPVLIRQTGLPVAFWSCVRTDGLDLVFTEASVTRFNEGDSRYSRELVSIDATNQTMECYVRIPILSTNTIMRMWIGGTSIPNDTNVWSADYEFVSHFDNASALYDSTGKRTMTPTAPLTNLPGLIGNAVYMNSKQINLSNTNAVNVNHTIYTVVRQRTAPAFTPFITVAGSGNGGYNLRTWGTGRVGLTHILVADEPFNYTLTLNAWTHVVYVMNGASQVLYINGMSVDTKSYPFLKLPMGYIGATGAADFDVDTIMAVRRELSSNDVTTLYNNLNASFYTTGKLHDLRKQQSSVFFF
jgi:hypothetical protein